jgi:hypothetical protein
MGRALFIDRGADQFRLGAVRAAAARRSRTAAGGPLNRSAEMWKKSKVWLECPAGAALPDRDSLQADACAPSYRYDSHTRLALESKAEMRRCDVSSPDE